MKKTLILLTSCTWLFIAGQHEGYSRAVRDIDNHAFAGFVGAARAVKAEKAANIRHYAKHLKKQRNVFELAGVQ